MIDWNQIDTVLLDMDGTLLDLNYDNTLWSRLIPAKYGERQRISESEAQARLFAHMGEVRHRLEFYCLDYWATYTQLDVVALHHELSHLIQYRPGARNFLAWLGRRGTTRLLVTVFGSTITAPTPVISWRARSTRIAPSSRSM